MNKNPGEWLYEIVRNNFQGKPPWDRLCLEDRMSWSAAQENVIKEVNDFTYSDDRKITMEDLCY